jgi:hypothetical protein
LAQGFRLGGASVLVPGFVRSGGALVLVPGFVRLGGVPVLVPDVPSALPGVAALTPAFFRWGGVLSFDDSRPRFLSTPFDLSCQ